MSKLPLSSQLARPTPLEERRRRRLPCVPQAASLVRLATNEKEHPALPKSQQKLSGLFVVGSVQQCSW